MRICKVKDCKKKHKGHGYCSMHYMRWRRYNDPLYMKIARKQENHGMYNISEYDSWINMKQRCYNENHDPFHCYGDKGITVCNKWKDSFIAFYEDMGKKPQSDYVIDRINNNGNYEPGNCHWITKKESSRHRRPVKLNFKKAERIRKLYATGSISRKQIAYMFNVSYWNVLNIINFRIWKTT